MSESPRSKSPCKRHTYGPWRYTTASYETGKNIRIKVRDCISCDAVQYDGIPKE